MRFYPISASDGCWISLMPVTSISVIFCKKISTSANSLVISPEIFSRFRTIRSLALGEKQGETPKTQGDIMERMRHFVEFAQVEIKRKFICQ